MFGEVNALNDKSETEAGYIYKGELNEYRQPHGEGTMTYINDGSSFVGTWENGRRVYGTFIESNGDISVGYWTNDKLHSYELNESGNGSCTINYHNSKIFKGIVYQNAIFKGTLSYNGNTYTGRFENGQYNDNNGELKYKNGTIFRGEFKKGNFIKGIIIYSNKNEYHGHVYKDLPETHRYDPRLGKMGTKLEGKFICKNSEGNEIESYEGQWKSGKREGKGIWKRNDGLTYEGKLEKDVFIDGKFTKTNGGDTVVEYSRDHRNLITLNYKDGGTYTGDVFANLDKVVREGTGTMKTNNLTEIGTWKDDKLYDGEIIKIVKGVETIQKVENGELVSDKFSGSTKNGKRHGNGTLECCVRSISNEDVLFNKNINNIPHRKKSETYNIRNLKFIGNWNQDELVDGKIIFNLDGNYFETEIKDRIYTKNFKIIFKDGGKYQGETKNFECYGRGIMEYYKGSELIPHEFFNEKFGSSEDSAFYDGNWKNGKRDGEGVMTYSDGYIFEGTWKNNSRVKGTLVNYSGNKYDVSFDVNNMLNKMSLIIKEVNISGLKRPADQIT